MRASTGFVLLLMFFSSCRSGPSGFAKKTLHGKYAAKLEDAGLQNTELGRQWFSWSEKAIHAPVRVSLPYSETGYFEAAQPRASGLQFAGKRGQKVMISLTRVPKSGFVLFVDCWQLEGSERNGVFTADSVATKFEFEVEEDREYLLRIQPELLKGGEYTVSISTGPSLAFPVSGGRAKIGSIWGDSRDAGARSHQGVDIFASKGTPVVAATNGTIRSVTTNKLGGKVIFMRPRGKNISLYYAHLDKQLVSEGQQVRQGDTLGLVGNTGNARTTPPHLHFGIYTQGGAIDPFLFVNPTIEKPSKPALKPTEIKEEYRLKSKFELIINGGSTAIQYPAGTIIYGFRSSATHLIGVLPDGSLTSLNHQLLEKAVSMRKIKTSKKIQILDSPVPGAAARNTLAAATDVYLRGYFREFALVSVENQSGWISMNDIY